MMRMSTTHFSKFEARLAASTDGTKTMSVVLVWTTSLT